MSVRAASFVRAAAAMILLFTGCTGSRPEAPTPDGVAIVGPAGGTVSLPGGPTVVVPAGALLEDTQLTVQQSSAAPPAGALTPAYVFGPAGLTFSTPATVSFPIPAGTTGASVYWTVADAADVYEALATTSTGAAEVTASVVHFSSGFVRQPCTASPECSLASAGECAAPSCSAGTCTFQPLAVGTIATAQAPGDCHQNRCDGAGRVIAVIDDTDVPYDGKTCTLDVCSGGTPSNPPASVGTPCPENGGGFCDGVGFCAGGTCLAAGKTCSTNTDCCDAYCPRGVCLAPLAP